MTYVVAVIAAGAMGSSLGRILVEHDVAVRTSLGGRSATSKTRAADAGMADADDAAIAAADVILSVVPPAEALPLARRLAPALTRATHKPIYLDCNAISPTTVAGIGELIAATGARFVDACIIGLPPKRGGKCPALYVSGPHADAATPLLQFGIDVRVMSAPVGAASALKMSYAGITKGLTGLAAAMILAADRAGAGDTLRIELQNSQPALLQRFETGLPDMYPKAYRWVAEMLEIGQFAADDAATQAIFNGMAGLYQRLAEDHRGERQDAAAIDAFLAAVDIREANH